MILFPVTPHSSLASRIVAAAEIVCGVGWGLEGYSHCAIMSEKPGFQWEAKWPRVGLYPTQQSRPREVWRIEGLTLDQRRLILEYCATQQGNRYNVIGLLSYGLLAPRHQEVCSQLVGNAYEHAKRPLCKEGKRIMSPNSIPDDWGAHMLERAGSWPARTRKLLSEEGE